MHAHELVKEERHFSVYLLQNDSGRFLLQLRPKSRNFLPHYWCTFGGRVRVGETPFQSVRRKAREELGYVAKNPKYVLSTTFEHKDFKAHLHIFTERFTKKQKLQIKDGENWGWFDADHLDTLKIQRHDRELIRYVHVWLNSLRERDVVIIFLFDKKGNILLQKRDNEKEFLPGYWSFFGGGIEPGESPREAVTREAFEELKYKVNRPRLIMKTSFQHPKQKSNMHIFVEKCESKWGLKLQEGADWAWVGEDGMDDLHMLESDKYILSYAFEYIKKMRENGK
ncbi:NUDIX domain-containing protein [Candidatus Uhrbacteria bacterium]|nr:NUDIX domain-containing protein [Candidatus Uhrbacteria bacterium]